MLRNTGPARRPPRLWFLNEVLSLNAQESRRFRFGPRRCSLLNEVLSLNAQELKAREDGDPYIYAPQ